MTTSRVNLFLLTALLLIGTACRKKIEPQKIDTLLDVETEFEAIDMRGADTIVAVGGSRYYQGDVYVTFNGGATWDTILNITNKALYAVHFINDQQAVAGGYDGRYLESTNGGVNWVPSHFTNEPIRGFASRGDRLLMCGGHGLQTGFVRTRVGVGTLTVTDSSNNEFRALIATDSGSMYAAGYGLVMRSDDSGDTWQPTEAKNDFFIGLAHVGSTVYAAGMNGTVIATSDEGKTWTHLKHGNSPSSLSVLWNAFDGNDRALVIGGEGGKLFRYDFSGGGWERVDTKFSDDLTGVKLVGNDVYCVSRQGKVMRVRLP